MIKFFLSLGLVVLLGVGCTTKTDVKTEINTGTSTDTQANQPSATDTSVPGETEATTTVNLSAGKDGDIQVTTIDSGDGVELVVETKPDTNADVQTDEEGIVDVVLGETVGQTINMETGNFFFKPSTITAKPGERLKIQFQKNSGFHTLVIDEIDFQIPVTENDNVLFTAPQTVGNYTFYCDIGSHQTMGMQGTLIVK